MSTQHNIKYGIEDIKDLYDSKQEQEEKEYSARLTIGCKSDKSSVYVNETAKVSCDLKNTGNLILKDLEVCLLDNCQKMQLGITQERTVKFDFSPEKITDQPILKANNVDVAKIEKIDVKVVDKPSLAISDLSVPVQVGYDDTFITKFTIKKKSVSNIENLNIKLYKDGKLRDEWQIASVTNDQPFEIEMLGSNMDPKENNYKIELEWRDDKGRYYQTDKEFEISLVDVNFWQKIKIFFRNIGEAFSR